MADLNETLEMPKISGTVRIEKSKSYSIQMKDANHIFKGLKLRERLAKHFKHFKYWQKCTLYFFHIIHFCRFFHI